MLSSYASHLCIILLFLLMLLSLLSLINDMTIHFKENHMKDIELCTEQITIFSINIPMNIIYI